MEKLVSICLLSYNHERFIEYCIESIWNQEYKNIEILVLDDGSKDNSVTLLNKLKEKSPCKMQVFSQENSGCIGGNFNKLIKQAKGEYISFIACDDALFKDAISKKIEIMEKDKKIQFVINSQIQWINNDNKYYPTVQKMNLDKIENPTAKDILYFEFNELHSYFIQGCLYKKSIIDKVEGFDEDMISDDMVLRTKLSNYLVEHQELNFVTLHEPACLYRRHETNISSNSAWQAKSIFLFLTKYMPNKNNKIYQKAYKRLLNVCEYKMFFDEFKKRKELKKYIPLLPFWLIEAGYKYVIKKLKRK